jgi:hypothetical protein
MLFRSQRQLFTQYLPLFWPAHKCDLLTRVAFPLLLSRILLETHWKSKCQPALIPVRCMAKLHRTICSSRREFYLQRRHVQPSGHSTRGMKELLTNDSSDWNEEFSGQHYVYTDPAKGSLLFLTLSIFTQLLLNNRPLFMS